MAIKRCLAPFVCWKDGAPRAYTAGQLIEDTDPAYKGREHLFEAVEVHMATKAGQVEQATADPGEKRSMRRPARAPKGKSTSEDKGEGS